MSAFDPFEWMVRSSIRRSVRTGLRGVWVRGELPSGAAIIAPSHHSWWDGYALRELAWQLRQPFTVLMTERQLGNFPFLRSIGAIGTHELRPAVQALKSGHWLVVFPEGRIEPLGRLRQVEGGAAWLSKMSGAPIIPVALRVVLRGQPKPEAYLRFGRAAIGPELPNTLQHELDLLDAELSQQDPEQPLAGYLRLTGQSSLHDERIDLPTRLLARLTR
ncbi:lysophospholipid acyltransferase family protein [Deinococcus sp.]|uniref:lysophospholipid acyltransferase family protein n=1 Tax=Deinococcus sp. TaxID=47478 RepID=UPI003B5A2964